MASPNALARPRKTFTSSSFLDLHARSAAIDEREAAHMADLQWANCVEARNVCFLVKQNANIASGEEMSNGRFCQDLNGTSTDGEMHS